MLRTRQFRQYAVAVVILVALSIAWVLRPIRWEFEQAAPNRFIRELTFEQVDDATPVPLTVTLPPDGGYYVRIDVLPSEEYPRELDGRVVQDPPAWSFALRIYQRGADPDSAGSSVRLFTHYLREINTGISGVSLPASVPVAAAPFGPNGRPEGLLGQPKPPETIVDGRFYLWTWFGPWRGYRDSESGTCLEPGEYVYEVIMYPTAAWTSSVRFEVGEPIVLIRGLLQCNR